MSVRCLIRLCESRSEGQSYMAAGGGGIGVERTYQSSSQSRILVLFSAVGGMGATSVCQGSMTSVGSHKMFQLRVGLYTRH